MQAAGIDLPLAEARLVLMLASRVICHGQSKDRGALYVAARFIHLIVSCTRASPGRRIAAALDQRWSSRCASRTARRLSSGWASSRPTSPHFGTSRRRSQPRASRFSACSPSCPPRRGRLWPHSSVAARTSSRRASTRRCDGTASRLGRPRCGTHVTRLSLVMRTLVDPAPRAAGREREPLEDESSPLLELPAGLDGWTALPDDAHRSRAGLEGQGRPRPPRRLRRPTRTDPRGAREPPEEDRLGKAAAARLAAQPRLANAQRTRRALLARSRLGRASTTSACSTSTTSTPHTASRMARAVPDCAAAEAR